MSGPGKERERIWESRMPRTQGRWRTDALENGLQAILHEVGHQVFLLRKTFGKSLPHALMPLGEVDQKKGKTCRNSWWLAKTIVWGFLKHCLNFPQRKAFFCSSERFFLSPLPTPAPERGFFSLREAKLKAELRRI